MFLYLMVKGNVTDGHFSELSGFSEQEVNYWIHGKAAQISWAP